MKLSIIGPDPKSRLVSNIRRNSKKLGISVITLVPTTRVLDGIIVIGNGRPEDIIVSIIAHHLDGDSIVGIVKPPGRTGLSVIETIPTYLRENIDKILVLIDQDDHSLENLFDQCQEKLNDCGIRINDEQCEDQLKIYECVRGSRAFKMILAINGLDEIPVRKHSIEDHLLKVAMSIEAIGGTTEEFESSKEIWKTLEQVQKDKVLRILTERRNMAQDMFSQQFTACRYLKEL
jgi:hypothetical protein